MFWFAGHKLKQSGIRVAGLLVRRQLHGSVSSREAVHDPASTTGSANAGWAFVANFGASPACVSDVASSATTTKVGHRLPFDPADLFPADASSEQNRTTITPHPGPVCMMVYELNAGAKTPGTFNSIRTPTTCGNSPGAAIFSLPNAFKSFGRIMNR